MRRGHISGEGPAAPLVSEGHYTASARQRKHRYLYLGDCGQLAVREGAWKAIRTAGPKGKWELYDLAADLAETTDLSSKHPDILARLTAHAAEAHTPIQEGQVLDRDLVLKDRYIPLGKPIPAKPWGPPPKGKKGKA
ncbi:MAG: hypothetical protein FJ291_30060 [Planctomycetes bacterium]|nr:hypothetical protein [Planctomycetota bacterium]